MKNATLFAIIGTALLMGTNLLSKLIIQMRIFGNGNAALDAIGPTVFDILEWGHIAGWGLLLYFFIDLYKKQ